MMGRNLQIGAALLFFALLAGAVLGSGLSVWVPVLYGVLSAVTLMAYRMDKSAAQKGTWRTPEKTLHLLALAGGWPGALIAQQMMRHKTQKGSFRMIFWLTVLLNCGLLVALVILGQGGPALGL